jgi:hypothetical protein
MIGKDWYMTETVPNEISFEEAMQRVSGKPPSVPLEMKLSGFLSAFLFFQAIEKEHLHTIAVKMAEKIQTVEQLTALIRSLVASEPRLHFEDALLTPLSPEIVMPALCKSLSLESPFQVEANERTTPLIRFV